jgi:hypothetical protein
VPLPESRGLYIAAAGKFAERVPGLRALPVVRLIMAGEVAVLGKHHLDKLNAAERGQLIGLLTKAKGRPKNLSPEDQQALSAIVEKLEARTFLVEATDKLSPVGVPKAVKSKMIGRPPNPPV